MTNGSGEILVADAQQVGEAEVRGRLPSYVGVGRVRLDVEE